jgi:uncharacterized protein (UPF0333 family)
MMTILEKKVKNKTAQGTLEYLIVLTTIVVAVVLFSKVLSDRLDADWCGPFGLGFKIFFGAG